MAVAVEPTAALVGAFVGEFFVGDEFVGDVRTAGCNPNAICGVPIVGTGGVCGAMWSCITAPDLVLGPYVYRLLDAALAEVHISKPSLVLQSKATQLVPDSAAPSQKPALVLYGKQTQLGLDQTWGFVKPPLILVGSTVWGHRPGLVTTIPEDVLLTPSPPQEEILVPSIPISEDVDWLLRPTIEEKL